MIKWLNKKFDKHWLYKRWQYKRFKIQFSNYWWNLNLWIYDFYPYDMPYGKEYNLTFFIPHRVKKWLVEKSK